MLTDSAAFYCASPLRVFQKYVNNSEIATVPVREGGGVSNIDTISAKSFSREL